MIDNSFIVNLAKKFGFELVGFAKAENLDAESKNLKEWLNAGYNAGMEYMRRNEDKRKDVKRILVNAKSVISLGINYYSPEQHSTEKNFGKVSRYAWGKDYHLIIWQKLDEIVKQVKKIDPEFEAMSYVDTGPVMDKAWAVRSGLGWIGKNTNVINNEIGSWFFIASIITNWKFDYAKPVEDFCGTCTACIDACPTDAIVQAYVLDSNRCISYLTIENKKEIPAEFKNKFENWIFGCDICQNVCPWNIKFSQGTNEAEFYPVKGNKEMDLETVLSLKQEDFNQRFVESPIKRTKLKGLKRNAEFILNSK